MRLTSDVPDRLALWYAATLMMIDHPLTGVGPGRTIQLAQNVDRYEDTPFGAAESSAHNSVLLAGAETGVIGALGALLVNIGFALAALRILVRARRPAVAGDRSRGRRGGPRLPRPGDGQQPVQRRGGGCRLRGRRRGIRGQARGDLSRTVNGW